MDQRARALAITGIDAGLAALGYRDTELALARSEVRDWGRTRLQAANWRTGVVQGLRIVVSRRGHAELRPFDCPLAGPQAVTVEVHASAISPGTERAQWLRLPNLTPEIPHLPGYSIAGRVLRAGPGAEVQEGELVAVPRVSHSSVATVPAEWVTRVPEGVDEAHAALVYLAMISGYGIGRSGLRHGESLCVVGAGPIGALAQRLAMLRSPGDVTVIAASRKREAEALDAGVTTFLASGDEIAAVRAARVIEATGDPSALGVAVEAAEPGATVVLLGSPCGRTPTSVLADAQEKQLRLVGAHISALVKEYKERGEGEEDPFRKLADEFIAALAGGSIAVADLAGEPLDPREAQLSYRRLARGEIRSGHFDWTLVPEPRRMTHRRFASAPRLSTAPARVCARSADHPSTGARGRIRFALIGCGDIGLHNARAIAAAASADLVLTHDPALELALAAAQAGGAEVAAELEAALDPARVDAVCICTPHDLHTPLVEEAAAAGLHVVVEKPLANDLAAGRRASDAAAAARVELSVCLPYRYEPAMELARDLIRDGALGELHGASIVFHMDMPESYWVGGFSGRSASDWRSSQQRAGGGVLIMNIVHYIDFIRYIAGLEPTCVSACTRVAPGWQVEDGIAIAVEFEGGAIGAVSASASTRGAPGNRFELWGELGTLRLEPEPAVYTERALGELPPGRWCRLPEGADTETDARADYFERFATAILRGEPVEPSAADGLALQAFVDAAYRAAELGTSVALESQLAETA